MNVQSPHSTFHSEKIQTKKKVQKHSYTFYLNSKTAIVLPDLLSLSHSLQFIIFQLSNLKFPHSQGIFKIPEPSQCRLDTLLLNTLACIS